MKENITSQLLKDLTHSFALQAVGHNDRSSATHVLCVRTHSVEIHSDVRPHVGVDLDRMRADAEDVRGGRPVIMTNCLKGEGVGEVLEQLRRDVLFH